MLALLLVTACSKEQNFYTTSPDPVGGSDSATPDGTDADGDGYDEDIDCDDSDADVHPDATEVCNGIDDDCDELVDDDDDSVDLATTTYWYEDFDLDGYGDPDTIAESCSAPSVDHILVGGDCDDSDGMINPDATEVCNEVDDDCDLLIDDDDDDVDPATQIPWFADLDGDGYGDPNDFEFACVQIDGRVEDDNDCDDGSKGVNPGQREECNDLDDDCDGYIDDDDASLDLETANWYWEDADGDGYGNEDKSQQACDKPDGWKSNKKDCDDTDADINPDAAEICDGEDNDCDSATPEDGTASVGSASYGTIQAAVDAASSGDTVTICDGTFYENIDTSVSLTLESLNGSGSVTLDGRSKGAVVTAGAQLTVSGFTIQNGSGPLGGGIDGWTNDAGTLTIEDCTFTDNSATYGGGVLGPPSYDLDVSDSEFKNGDVTNSGGGVYITSGSLSNVTVHDNEADYGGGVFVDYGGSATFDSSTDIYDNDATYGGGVFLYGATLDGDDATIRDNDADDGGGVFMTDSNNSLSNATVSGNTADYGAGLLSENYSGQFVDTVDFSSNVGSYGGAVYVYGGSMEIENSTLDANTASYGGGILLILDGTLTVDACTLTNNGATGGGDGGGLLIYKGDLWSYSTDWGSGTSDNTPEDIYSWVTDSASSGTSTAFSCDESGC
ncbi:MAG TPA: MopE-related protein [Myxococcota bacterium]|nr:MopE-related protein [Myxococcota bacterium]